MLINDIRDYHNIDHLVNDMHDETSALQAAYGSSENIAAHYAVDALEDVFEGLLDNEKKDIEIKQALLAHLDILYFDADADFNRDEALKISFRLFKNNIMTADAN
jgi:hypothetical protein